MARAVVPVADLRREPQDLLPKNFDHHDLRDSQLLFNEELKVLETKGEWARVAALEQLRFTSKRGWHPYEGWVHKSEIGEGNISPKFVISSHFEKYSYGTYLDIPLPGARPIPKEFDREQLVEDAKKFLDAPYLFGGRSSCLPDKIASVDCSSLINLLYRGQGISLPRDAHDQFLFGERVATPLPGDLLYLAKAERINHVVLKLFDDIFIESPESGKQVRLLKWGKDIWEKDRRFHFRDRPHCYRGFPTSFDYTELGPFYSRMD